MKVAIQGYKNSFHAIAAEKIYGQKIDLIYCETFKETFNALKNGLADEAVVAIENSLYGSLNEVYDLLAKHKFWIHHEIYEQINLYLFGNKNSQLESIYEIYSHPAALAEAEAFLDKRLPQAKRHEYHDTAASAEFILNSDDLNKSAISGRTAGESLGLKILAKNIETHPNNYTRFFALTKKDKISPVSNKTSLTFRTNDKPGSLYTALGVFAKANINLTKLESRPIVGEVWQYMYYADIAMGYSELIAGKVYNALEECTSELRILGSYQAGKIITA